MKIICIGMNYRQHIAELGHQIPQYPVFFLKPDTSILRRNRPFFLPDFSQNVQYELEVVVKIDKVGKCISPRFASTYYHQIGLGIDFTARDIQQQCRKEGLPWTIAKGFDNSAAISNFVPKNTFSSVNNLNFKLLLNDKTVQNGNTADMIFDIDHLISYISQFMTLKTGDLLFTGTPCGVGKLSINDRLTAYLENMQMMNFLIK
ncbi:MAG: fumarylacetoacetate hydrolase family protein [Bacteroidales bacterium]|jgi:2-keto-4-pentenoate hydratase/2-oxohepta-3-ene-1,7-dioic acid hydratase in catechol pathway|nr:fumarylacetoacetate hydrolase family protein [Bacteroidales bacterium]